MTHRFYTFSLLLLLTACNDNAQLPEPISKSTSDVVLQQNTDKKKQLTSDKSFDLEKVKTQYAGILLSVRDANIQTFQNRPALTLSLSVPLNPSENHQNHLQVVDHEK